MPLAFPLAFLRGLLLLLFLLPVHNAPAREPVFLGGGGDRPFPAEKEVVKIAGEPIRPARDGPEDGAAVSAVEVWTAQGVFEGLEQPSSVFLSVPLACTRNPPLSRTDAKIHRQLDT